MPEAGAGFDAVITDYGGVLTAPTREAMLAFCVAEGVDPLEFRALMREWLTPGAPANPIHALETGELSGTEFELLLAGRLRGVDGGPVVAEGLLSRVFAGSADLPTLVGALHRVKAAAVKVGLLSNSWGNEYPQHLWGGLFDDQVISGEVGLRKPDHAIYRLAAGRLGVDPVRCIFIDDLRPNVTAAVEVGMTGILHRDEATTIGELEVLLDLALT